MPGNFATRVKQINSQSDLIWMSSYSGPSCLTIRSSVLSNSNVSSLQLLIVTISSQLSTVTYASKLWKCALHSNNRNTRTSFCYIFLLGQFQLKLFYCVKSRQNFASNVNLYPLSVPQKSLGEFYYKMGN